MRYSLEVANSRILPISVAVSWPGDFVGQLTLSVSSSVQISDRAESCCIATAKVEESPNPLAPSDSALAAIRVCCSRFDQPIA